MTDRDQKMQRVGRALFRVMLSGIFLVASFNHLFRPQAVIRHLMKAPLAWLATSVAPPEVLSAAAGIGLLLAGMALLLGFKSQWAALALIVMLIPITVVVQVGTLETIGPLFKNIGLAGGLLYFLTHGADVFSVDALLLQRAEAGGLADAAPGTRTLKALDKVE